MVLYLNVKDNVLNNIMILNKYHHYMEQIQLNLIFEMLRLNSICKKLIKNSEKFQDMIILFYRHDAKILEF